MKKIYFYLLVFISMLYFAQSVSASRLFYYTNIQNIGAISKELKQLGFQIKTDNSEGYSIYQFTKKSPRAVENIEMGKNSELFMFTYKPEFSVYKVLKSKMLTSDFQYAYSYKNAKYYENGKLRIGADDVNGIISIFKPLK